MKYDRTRKKRTNTEEPAAAGNKYEMVACDNGFRDAIGRFRSYTNIQESI